MCTYDVNEWIIDTGATHHITSQINTLTTCMEAPANSNSRVHLPNRNTVLVSHIGITNICTNQNISNVLFLPDFKVNLLPVSKLTKELTAW